MPFLSQEHNKKSFVVATDEKDFRLNQDVGGYIAYAERQRQLDTIASSKRNYRSWCIIPDIVAVELLTKHGLNIHDPNFLSNPNDAKKLERIIETEYPKLKTSNMNAR
jgi:hypothetical protein